jgi:uncharacterized protein YecE (DUF72 family)
MTSKGNSEQSATCRWWVGTSGYNYPEWRGSFYPEKFPTTRMLAYYAERLATVEINNTFYRAPTVKQLAAWAEVTPPTFKLTLKAPRRITHDRRLADCGELVRYLCETADTLGERLGAILFQLPPNFRKNVEVFDRFVEDLPPGIRVAFEFRHESWLAEEMVERLRARNAALVIADSETKSTPPVATANFGYLRLRDEGYQPADIARWAGTIRDLARSWHDAFVYFKHEGEGKGPEFARQLIDRLAEE